MALSVGEIEATLRLRDEMTAQLRRVQAHLSTFGGDLSRMGGQMMQAGTMMTAAFTVPIALIGGGAVKAAMDFESAFADVKKTITATEPEFQKLSADIRQMSKEIPVTSVELSKIAALGGQMGISIGAMDEFVSTVAALDVAVDGIDAETAAAGLAQIGNASGTGTTYLKGMASALVHLGNNAASTEGEILEFTKRLVGAGTNIGLTLPQVMAIGTAMANVGINAEAGGTAFSTVLKKMSLAVTEGGAHLDAFAKVAGKSASEFAAQFKAAPIEAINAFVAGLHTARGNGEDLNVVFKDLGTSGIRVADTLARLSGAGNGVADMLVYANQGFESQDKHLIEAHKKYETFANKLQVVKNQLYDVGVTIGGPLLEGLKNLLVAGAPLIRWAESMAKAFTDLGPSTQAAIVATLGLIALGGPALLFFGAMVRGVGDISSAYVALTKIGPSVVSMWADLGRAGTGITAWATSAAGPLSGLKVGFSEAGLAAGGATTLVSLFSAAVGGIVVGVALVKVVEALTQVKGLLDDINGRANDGANRAAETMRLLAEASRVAGRAIQDPNEALRILRDHAMELQSTHMPGLAGAMTGTAITFGAFGAAVTAAGGAVKAAAVDPFKALREEAKALQTQGLTPLTAVQRELALAFNAGGLEVDKIADKLHVNAQAVKVVIDAHEKLKTTAEAAAKALKDMGDAFKGTTAMKDATDLFRVLDLVGGVSKMGKDQLEALSQKVTQLAGSMTRSDPAQAMMIRHLTELGKEAALAAIALEKLELIKPRVGGLATNLNGGTIDNQIPLRERNSLNSERGVQALPTHLDGLTTQIILSADAAKVLKKNTEEAFKTATEHAKRAVTAVNDLANSFAQMAQIAGPSFGPILKGAGQLLSGLAAAKKAEEEYSGSVGIASAMFDSSASGAEKWASAVASAATIVSGVMSIWSSTANDGSKAAGAFHGAMSGASAGAAFGPWGAAIGAAGGALLGFIHTLTAGRRAVVDFADSFNTAAAGDGFTELHNKLLALGEEGEQLWIKLTQKTKKGDKSAAQAVIEEINTALSKQDAILAAVEAAGFKTNASLFKTAETAQQVYEYMKEQGTYSAEAIAAAAKAAMDATEAALIASGDKTAIAAKQAREAIATMDSEIKSLTESIKDEAPEEVMGVVEEATRARIAAIEQSRNAAQAAIDDTTAAAAAAAEEAGKIIDAALAARLFLIKVKAEIYGLPGEGPDSTKPVPSYANEGGPFSTPHLAVIGDASEPEYVLRQSTIERMQSEGGGGGDIHVEFHLAPGTDSQDLRAAGEEIVNKITDVVRRGGAARSRLQKALGVS